jgi:hypothetical protein
MRFRLAKKRLRLGETPMRLRNDLFKKPNSRGEQLELL